MATGQVKWFNARKGYGFITPEGNEEGENDVFVHYSAIEVEGDNFKTLHENDKVEYEEVDGDKGKEARSVKVTEAAPYEPRQRRDDY